MLEIFKLGHSKNKIKILTYDEFLKNIDEKSRNRLNTLENSISIFRHLLEKEGFNFDECACTSKNIRILRNQFGFFVDETHSLDSQENYHFYQIGLAFFYKFKEKFVFLDKLLCEKEWIMSGNYECRDEIREDLNRFTLSMGYGKMRKDKLYESEYDHPSLEYQRLVILLDLVKNQDFTNKDDIIQKCLDKICKYLKPRYRIEIKHINDKYGLDFDSSFGILVIDNEQGEMKMLYEVDGLKVIKSSYQEYFYKCNPYLDVYFRIISYCLKEELLYDFRAKVV